MPKPKKNQQKTPPTPPTTTRGKILLMLRVLDKNHQIITHVKPGTEQEKKIFDEYRKLYISFHGAQKFTTEIAKIIARTIMSTKYQFAQTFGWDKSIKELGFLKKSS